MYNQNESIKIKLLVELKENIEDLNADELQEIKNFVLTLKTQHIQELS